MLTFSFDFYRSVKPCKGRASTLHLQLNHIDPEEMRLKFLEEIDFTESAANLTNSFGLLKVQYFYHFEFLEYDSFLWGRCFSKFDCYKFIVHRFESKSIKPWIEENNGQVQGFYISSDMMGFRKCEEKEVNVTLLEDPANKSRLLSHIDSQHIVAA